MAPNRVAEGILVGLLIGEGHFGGDGRQPQVVLRMHVDHASLFAWVQRSFPGGRLYGPYHHGGRHYYQWMARGSYLRQVVMPILDRFLTEDLDERAYRRYLTMKETYRVAAEPPQRAGSGTMTT